MIRRWQIDPTSALPLWKQIEEGVRRLIATGALAPGDDIPSVRDLARELQVNPNTVSKAYQKLADVGVLIVRRGEGTFVNDSPPALLKSDREKQLRRAAVRFAALASTLGTTVDEASAALQAAFKDHRFPWEKHPDARSNRKKQQRGA